MKAFTKTKYGGPEVLQLEEVEKPPLKDDHILVKVVANSANPADWHVLRGIPVLARMVFGLFKPKTKILGADFAGVVEAVGNQATHFNVGDRVFGENLKGGAFAEYTSVAAKACGLMPERASFPEMASVPIAGLTALQALITHGKLKAGESVLVNGASGGVGHLTVQIAKAYGAKVTGVCSSKNTDFVKALGADEVIAYDKENIHHHAGKYDLIVDTHGNLSYADFERMGQRGVMVGFTTMGLLISSQLKKMFGKFPLSQFTAAANTKDLETLASLIQTGKIKVHIEKTFSYKEIPAAIAYIEAMRTREKWRWFGKAFDNQQLMKFTPLLLSFIGLSFSMDAQTFSPHDWATYHAPKKTHLLKIDGDLEDWRGVKAFSLDQEKYFFAGQGMSSSTWKGVADLSGNFKVQWDETYIYVAVEVRDDKVTPPHGSLVKDNTSGSWDDDGIEVMFDHDGCGKSKYYVGDSMHHEYHFVYDAKTPFVFDNFWVPDANAPQPMFTLPNGEKEPLAYPGEAMSKNEVTQSFSNSPYEGAYHFKRTRKGYNLELKMKLPGTIMKPINQGGHQIGFDICINDNDEGKGPLKQQLHWSGMNGIFWRDCKYFGTLVLVDK